MKRSSRFGWNNSKIAGNHLNIFLNILPASTVGDSIASTKNPVKLAK
jgi:hypothetical protein